MQAPTEREAARGRVPGAMTQAMSAWVTASERVVRVALTRGDRIESEVLATDTLRVGSRESADLLVRDARYGGKLFVRSKKGWILRVPEGVHGKLANGGAVGRIDPGAAREIELAPDARGRLETAEGALLFQLIVPPPAMPAPRLPASVQNGVFGAVDWHFTAITVAVFMLFFGATVMLEAADFPLAGTGRSNRDIRAVLDFIQPDPPPDPAATWAQQDPIPETDVEPDTETETETETETDAQPSPQRADRSPTRQRSDDSTPSLSVAEMRSGIVLAIGTLAQGGEGAFGDMLADGGPTTEHAQLFEDIDRVEYATRGMPTLRNTHRCDESCADDEPGTIREMRRPTQIAVAGPEERRPLGTVERLPIDPIDTDGEFDPAALVRRIRGKSSSIARCYEGELTRHPDLAGRVDAEITVMPAGNLRVEIAGNTTGSNAVAGCVERHLATIRLTEGPDGSSVTLGFPFVFSPQR